ncbi:MAG TPA: hypothetical protein VK892_17535 [Pyrinomonadaceae bacterium]|nr:hypothetical protein [Pyrinomonadaceae bacterium]
MIQTIEAIIDTDGRVILRDEFKPAKKYRALVTILDEEPKAEISDTALLSEKSLAEDWNSEEENEAWRHLNALPSC